MHTIKSDLENASANLPDPEQAHLLQEGWSFFERIFCISLASREDRRQKAREQFSRVGLAARVEFLIVEKHPTNCEEGIYTSHMTCMAKGLANGADHILIFEDDVVFERFSLERLHMAVDFLRHSKDWQIFFLGCLVKMSRKTANPAIVHVRYGALTHAYAVHRKFAQELVEHHPWNNIAFDDFLRDFPNSSQYAIFPSCAFQSNASSDNDPHLPLDRFRRLCGGLQNIQKWNERYHRHKFFIIGCHVLVIIALVLWL